MRGPSDHFDGRRFRNPSRPAPKPFSAVPRMLREPRAPWPRHVDVIPRAPSSLDAGAEAMVTFVGHSTFLIQTPAGNVLTDPMYSDRAGPLNIAGPRRVRAPGVRIEDLPRIDIVLLSHNHYDHCDLRTLRNVARRFNPMLVTPLGNGRLARRTGIRRVEELDWWERSQSAPLPITLTPAHHFSARTPWDRNRALWGGFLLRAGRTSIYFAGDSAYAPFFGEIPRRLGAIDVALLPIGAYEPRWFMQAVHMNPAEAVQAHLDLGAPASIGMHFGTFQLTSEGIDDPLHDLAAALREREVPPDRFATLEFGGSRRIPSRSD